MAILDIRTLPDRVLKQKAIFVSVVDACVIELMDNMLETMYAGGGIGLAANQVGILRRVIVVDIWQDESGVSDRGGSDRALQMANPEIVEVSQARIEHEEGCLSVPGYTSKVERASNILVRYLDRDGVERRLRADGLLSICLQHEIDHLDGIVFVDRISFVKRGIILRKLQKASRESV